MDQRGLFDSQLGARERDKGVARVTATHPNFVEIMRSEALRLAQRHGRVTADDLRAVAEELGIAPRSPNAWGAIFRGSGLRPGGFVKSRFVSNHRRWIRVWEWPGSGGIGNL